MKFSYANRNLDDRCTALGSVNKRYGELFVELFLSNRLKVQIFGLLAMMTLAVPLFGQEPRGAEVVPEGQDLVNMDFPELTDIKDIIKAVALWTGKNVILDRNVTGKVQIISPKPVTKEEAYQAFLSALNMLNLTTVETGKVIKIVKVRNAVKGNLKTYLGSSWAPRTDEIITQIIPLKYIDAKQIQTTLSRIVSSNALIAYEPTNTLIISDSGYKVRRVLEILELIDVQTQQPKVVIVPIKHSDPKSIAEKVNEILRASAGTKRGKKSRSPYHSFKILTDDRSNSVIVFGPPRTINDVKALVQKFDVPLDDPSAQASIHVRPLDYADAKKLATTLSSLSDSRASRAKRSPIKRKLKRSAPANSVAKLADGVKITADESSNSLLITGARSDYDSLNSIIRKLDTRRSQVFVEAEILDLTRNDGFNFGTSIFAGVEGGGTKQLFGWEAAGISPVLSAQAAASGRTLGATEISGVFNAFSSDMTIGILAGQKINVPGLGEISPGAMIRMMKEDSNSRVLSSPHILTANNEEASISVGETLFFRVTATNTGSVTADVKKENVDLTLNIRPNISHSNYVTMKLDLDANSVKSINADGTPVVSKRKTKQLVTVKNGQTVIVSGLMRMSETEAFKKIPLLGDIPILGWLFRNTTLKKEHSNLVIFLTPHIIHGPGDLAAIYERKVKERNEMLVAMYGSKVEKSEFYKKLPKLSDGAYKPDEIDRVEEQKLRERQADTLKAMGYDQESAAEEGDQSTRRRSGASSPITVPVGGVGGGYQEHDLEETIDEGPQQEVGQPVKNPRGE